MKASEILRAAKALIADPIHWANRCPSKEEQQKGLHCSVTALCEAEGHNRYLPEVDKYIFQGFGMEVYTYLGLGSKQDHMTHEQVMACWDKAIALAEAEEQK